MKRDFFFSGTSRFTFLNEQIEDLENVKNEDLTVYDGRVKSVKVKELLEQDLSPLQKGIMQSLDPDDIVIVNYIEQIGDEPLLGETGDSEADAFFTEMNDRKFHAQHFCYMYLPMIESAAKRMTGESIWNLDEKNRIFQYTMACYLGILRKEYPFGDFQPAFSYVGLPEKDQSTLTIIFPSKS